MGKITEKEKYRTEHTKSYLTQVHLLRCVKT